MRLDKFLADMGFGSRKEVKGFIKKGLVQVNGVVVKSDKFQVAETSDQVIFEGEQITYQKDFYYLLNKPQGVISATQDNHEETVLDLFADEDYREDLFPVGRLDKDTEGLLLITNDGLLSHQLLSPKKHVEKEYYAHVSGVMTDEDVKAFDEGLVISGDEQTLPAKLTIVSVDEAMSTSKISLVLHEGKFHQVKRMVAAVGKEVTYLKRVRMGNLYLPEDIQLGSYRQLTEEELKALRGE
ncbi:16S rRNA pseudouridine(516) synthase [Enterococcus sp. JM4C]|uniref:pseudouridine synthase n=1 Tax=Candidatus Enterococcus huntleyi TaxID=1857217 RepID=UPI001379732C|nr:pseudouridine synthase [Enterococcus sp. JM4C]KAF1296683.1 16S rRNA pseudouridine(516) synthase [Enterococcus sp. JM4C]